MAQDSKQRLKAMSKSTLPITASAYNKEGTIFAYSVSCRLSRLHLVPSLPASPCEMHAARAELCKLTCALLLVQLSYDWSRGFQEYNPATMKNHIMLHSPGEQEVKNRSRPNRR